MYSSESRCAGLQLLAVFVGALTNHASSQNSNLRPNIVVIMADDLGYNDVSYHGSEIWTPNIDQLAVLGVRLENYYVAPQCGPSRAQFLSGRYNIHTGTQHSNFSPCRPSGLPLEYPTMAEEMKKLDYTTHMIGKWHLGHHREENLPTNRGFDTFRGMLLGSGDHYTHAKNYGGRPAYDLHEGTQPFNKTFGRYSTHVFTRRAENIIQQYGANQTQPLFMWLSYQAPHTPVQVPEKYEQQFDFIPDRKRRVFAGMVAALDEGVGSVVDALKRAGIYDNTLIVFTTDNGGQASSGSSNYPLKGNKNTFYEAGVRGVGFVSGPILSRSGVSDELTHITDWMPTLLHLAGADPTALELDGVNQWDSINTGSLTPREEVLLNIDVLELSSHESSQSSVFDTRIQAGLRWHDWKLLTGDPGYHLWVPQPQQDYSLYSSVTNMITNRAAEQNETVFLYNLRMDPYEQFNLVNVMPEIAMEMLSKLAAYQNTSIPSHNPPLDIRCNPHRNGHFWGPYISTGSRPASRNQSPTGQRNRQRNMFSSTTTPRDFGQGLNFGGLDSDGSIGGDISRKRPSNNGGRSRNNNRNNIFIGERDTV